jgi:glutathione S-transferase
MITLYGVYRSRASRPFWLLEETGQPYEHVAVIQGYRLPEAAGAEAPLNTTTPSFRAINPQGTIPVLEDDGLVLTESLAMTLYLARKSGGPLAPLEARETALTDQWMLFGATALESPGLDILYTIAQGASETAEGAAKIAAALDALARPMARLEAHLTGREWLAADRFMVADLMLAECLRYAQSHAGLMAAHPATQAWIARCQARPAFQAMMAKRNAEPA